MSDTKIKYLVVFALALIAFWALALISGAGTPKGWISDAGGTPVSGDFNGVYAAGQLALQGEPAAAYDFARHRQEQRNLTGDASAFYPWPYPPTFLFVAAALAAVPYYPAMLFWSLATMAAFAAVARRISLSPRDWLLILAMPALWLNLYIGQNGALTAALIGLGLVMLPARSVMAGVCFGLLSFKPHLGLLIPIALAAGGYWRAFAAAAAVTLALALTAMFAFGVEPWLAMPEQLQRVTAIVKSTGQPEKLQSLFGFARSVGAPADAALAAQLMLVAALAIGVFLIWRSSTLAYELKAAALAAAMTLASPYQFVYDLTILLIAQAFLFRHAARIPLSFVEIAGVGFANVAIFLFAATSVPLGFLGAILLAAIIARRVTRADAVSDPVALARAAGAY
jgi:arabinofuranan 3-O-arabinosyltransferase